MEGVVEAKHLSEKEIDYLLSLCSISTRKKTLSVKRDMVQNFLDQDSFKNRVDKYFHLSKEIQEIDDTLKELEIMIIDFEGPKNDSMYKILISRLIILSERVNRFIIPEEDSDPPGNIEKCTNFKKESYATCFELYTKLCKKGKAGDRLSFNPALNSTTIPSTAVTTNVGLSTKSVPIYKWGVTFDGTSSVKAFLERVSELAIARHVDEAELFQGSLDLFQGAALTWFRANRDKFNTWSDITEALSRDFLPPCYEESLLEQIKSRCQGKNENVNIYVSTMMNLFSRLSNPHSEEEKLKIIRRNLLPKYLNYLVLQDIKDISELITYCKKIDELTFFKNRYNPPAASCLESDLSYIEAQASGSQGQSGSNKQNNTSNNNRQLSRTVCWNCNNYGHTYPNCKRPRKKFCYKCGTPNVVVKTCQNCQKN